MNLTQMHLQQLQQIMNVKDGAWLGGVSDANVFSAQTTAELREWGYVNRVDGWNYLTKAGREALRTSAVAGVTA